MRNPLISAFVVVVIFWWGFFTWLAIQGGTVKLFTDLDASNKAKIEQMVTPANQVEANSPSDISDREKQPTPIMWWNRLFFVVSFLVCGFLMGILLVTLGIFSKKNRIVKYLSGESKRGLSISLGSFPAGRAQPKRVKLASVDPYKRIHPMLASWVALQLPKHPEHVALFNAITEVFLAHPNIPASHVSTGHGQISLFEHSQNVARTMIVRAKTFRYEGLFNVNGALIESKQDNDFELNSEDPLICLAGYAHDIGKIECFQAVGEGLVHKVGMPHAQVGGLILNSLPEFINLPVKDREALLRAISNYHDVWKMSTLRTADNVEYVEDRARALLMLLRKSDIEAAIEEQRMSDADLYYQDNVVEPINKLSATAKKNTDSAGLSKDQKRLAEIFESIVCDTGRINGGEKSRRIGFKHEKHVYISEPLMRNLIAEKLGSQEAAALINGRKQSFLTISLLEALSKMNILVNQARGYEFSPRDSLFVVTFVDPRKNLITTKLECALIIKASAYAALNLLHDCPRPPVDIAPRFGVKAAKRLPGVEATSEREANETIRAIEENISLLEGAPGAAVQAPKELNELTDADLPDLPKSEDFGLSKGKHYFTTNGEVSDVPLNELLNQTEIIIDGDGAPVRADPPKPNVAPFANSTEHPVIGAAPSSARALNEIAVETYPRQKMGHADHRPNIENGLNSIDYLLSEFSGSQTTPTKKQKIRERAARHETIANKISDPVSPPATTPSSAATPSAAVVNIDQTLVGGTKQDKKDGATDFSSLIVEHIERCSRQKAVTPVVTGRALQAYPGKFYDLYKMSDLVNAHGSPDIDWEQCWLDQKNTPMSELIAIEGNTSGKAFGILTKG